MFTVSPYRVNSANLLRNKENGSVLLIALIVLIGLVGFSVSYSLVTTSQSSQVNNSTNYATAMESAKAGFDMSRRILTSGHDNGWDDELTTSYNNYQTYSPTQTPLSVGTSTTGFQWARNISYEGGYFMATMTNNNDGGGATDDRDDLVILTVTSTMPDGSQGKIQALVRYKSSVYAPDSAVVTGGALKMWGSSKIAGTDGYIYATGDVDISGCSSTPAVSQGVYTPGDINASPGQIGGTGAHEGAPAPDVPSINPSEYFDYADFDLQADGKVYSRTGVSSWVLRGTANKTTAVCGWKYDSSTFTWSSSGEPESGTIYVRDGNIELNGNIGGVDKAWTASLLVMGVTPGNGNVTMAGTGNCIMTPDTGGIAVMAWNNIGGTGNMTVNNGLVAAHEQISIGGNLTVSGSVVAESATMGMYGLAVQEFGNADITYNGGLTTILKMGDPCVLIKGYKTIK